MQLRQTVLYTPEKITAKIFEGKYIPSQERLSQCWKTAIH